MKKGNNCSGTIPDKLTGCARIIGHPKRYAGRVVILTRNIR